MKIDLIELKEHNHCTHLGDIYSKNRSKNTKNIIEK
jgi:hypothetical protein